MIKQTDDQTFDVRLAAPPLEAQGLRFDTWGGAFILSNLLHKLDVPNEALKANANGIQVLELGAGTGLAGLSAGFLWKASVLLTDLDGVLPGIKDNIRLNDDLLNSHSASACCGTLDWRDPSVITLYPATSAGRVMCEETQKPGIILAADTMYAEEQPEILTNTIVAWLRKDRFSRAMICYPMRVAYIEYMQEFWQRMSDAGLAVAQEGRDELGENDGFDDERLCEWSVWGWAKEALQ